MGAFAVTDLFGRSPDDERGHPPDEFSAKVEAGEGFTASCDVCGKVRTCVTVVGLRLSWTICGRCYTWRPAEPVTITFEQPALAAAELAAIPA